MKTLVYSIHGYDKPFLEKATHGKHELTFTETALKLETAHLAKGFDAIALFTNDDASAPVLEILSDCGIRFITLRSVGFDHVDLESAKKTILK